MKKANKNFIPKLVRKSCATTLMMVLLPHPWISTASAQQQNSAIPMIMQGIQGVAGAVQQARVQAQMMTPIDLSPSMIKNVPAQNLPAPLNKCVIPQASIPMPRYCEQLGSPQEYTQPMGLAASPTYRAFGQTSEFAKKSILDLDRMLDEGKNEFSNGAITGVQCLKDSLTKEKTRQQGILNAIQGQIDKLSARNKQFKEQVKLVEMEMDKISRELTGQTPGSPSAHISDTINPPINYFPPNCQKLVERSGAKIEELGLVSLKDGSFKPTALKGGEFLANQQIYKNDIQRFINETRNYINKNGIQSFRDSGIPNFKGNQKLIERIVKSIDPINKKIKIEQDSIKLELDKVGYEAPPLDKNFSADFAAFKSDSKEFFRKQYVSNCVTNSNNGLTLNPKTILDALRQESTNNQGTTILSYKAALENILNADSFIEDKIQQLKALDASYGEGNITITLANAQAKLERMPPYMYFQNAVQACVADYNDDKTFSTSPSGRSYATKVERAEAYLNDLKKLNDTYVAQITEGIVDDIVNCSGRATEAGSCKLSGEGSFDVSSGSFCFASAQSCATEVNNCFAVADQLVKKKTTELNASADKFNGIVEGLFNDQARFFAEFKSSVLQEAGLLNALVPGADFVFPEDMFISLPELVLNKGVYVRGGSATEIGKKLAEAELKMKSLKDKLQAQGRLAESQLKDYIREQQDNIKENRDNFKRVAEACDQRLQQAERITLDYNKAMQEAEDKKRAAASGFCRRFYNLSTNPAAACGDVEELYEDSLEAAQMVAPMAARYTNDLRNLCTETQSEREAGTEDERSSSAQISENIARSCINDAPWSEAISSYMNQYLDSLPADSDRDAIDSYVSQPANSRKSVSEFLASNELSQDFKDDRQAMADLRSALSALEPPGYSKQSATEDITRHIPIPTEIQAKINAYPDHDLVRAITDAKKVSPIELHNKISNFIVQIGSSGSTQIRTELGYSSPETPITINSYNHSDNLALANRLMRAVAQLPPEPAASEEGDGCLQLKASALAAAAAACTANTSSNECIDDELEEQITSNRYRGSRGLASIGLRPNGQSNIEDEFARLGETGGMDCDALATNNRNPMNSLEAFDREILGDQYDDVMSGR